MRVAIGVREMSYHVQYIKTTMIKIKTLFISIIVTLVPLYLVILKLEETAIVCWGGSMKGRQANRL